MSSYSYPPIQPQSGFAFTDPIHHDTYAFIDSSTKSSLVGKSVFITGASKGVGRTTAISYAKAGASQIAIGARSTLSSLESEIFSAAKGAGKAAPEVLTIKLDVEDLSSVKQAAQEVQKRFGSLDILINNAGYLEDAKTIGESDEVEYWKTWEVNYRGVYWVTKEVLPLILRKEGGLKTIVNVSSVGAHGVRPGMSGYQASKYAILRFTEFLCAEYAGKGLVAFAIHPGGVKTSLSLRMPTQVHGFLVDTPEMGADTIVFLTQERREWLAGRYISCNWDMQKFLEMKDEIINGDKLKMRLVV